MEEKDILKKIASWFKEQWENAHEITDHELRKAEKIWQDRRNNRPTPSNHNLSLLEELKNNPYRFGD